MAFVQTLVVPTGWNLLALTLTEMTLVILRPFIMCHLEVIFGSRSTTFVWTDIKLAFMFHAEGIVITLVIP